MMFACIYSMLVYILYIDIPHAQYIIDATESEKYTEHIETDFTHMDTVVARLVVDFLLVWP